MKKLLLLFLFGFYAIAASAQWNGVTGTPQISTAGGLRWNFGPNGVYTLITNVDTSRTSGGATFNTTTGVLSIPRSAVNTLYTANGTVTGDRTVAIGTHSLNMFTTSGLNYSNLYLFTGGATLAASNTSTSAGAAFNASIAGGAYMAYQSPGTTSSLTIVPNLGFQVLDQYKATGIVNALDYSVNERKNRFALASVGATIQLADSVKGTYIPTWSSITSKPTTLSGYGITDAGSLSQQNTNTSNIATNTTNITANYTAIGIKQPRSLFNYTIGTNTAITSADSVVSAFGKVQAQINANSTSISSKAPLASPTFTGTVTLPIASSALKLNTVSSGVLMTNDGAGTVFLDAASGTGNVLLSSSPNMATPTMTVPNITGGYYFLTGTTSGQISLKAQAASGTYNWNYPTTAGNSGDVLTSAGGAASAMTWTTLGSNAFTSTAFAPLASPAFTGVPTAPTPATSDNSTSIATTAYVQANFAATTTYFTPGMFSGAGTAGSNYNWGSLTIPMSALNATGTASSTTYLRGDGTWSTVSGGFTNPMTTLGDIIYGGASGAGTRLAGNTTTGAYVLSQTGTGSVSAAPTWLNLFGTANTWSASQTVGVTNTASSGASNLNYGLFINNTVNQTGGSTGFSDIYVNRINTAPGGGGQNLLRLDVGGSSVFTINTAGGVTMNSSPISAGQTNLSQFLNNSSSFGDGVYVFNTNTAVSGTPSLNSPRVRWGTSAWNTTATAATNWAWMTNELRAVTGTTPTYALYWAANLSTTSTMGSLTDIMKLDNSSNLSLLNTVSTKHIIGSSSAPTIAAGTGAGTSPTVSLSGTDISGTVSITTGTTPSGSNAIVATITFNTAYGSAPKGVVLTPANINAVALSNTTQVFVPANGQTNGTTTTTFVVESNSTALAASTAYVWTYQVMQ